MKKLIIIITEEEKGMTSRELVGDIELEQKELEWAMDKINKLIKEI